MALVGGETAELPGIYREDELDFAGTCVGLVERDAPDRRLAVEDGDVVVGLASAGVHANGFTLVRRVLEDEDYAGDDLLAPTRLYLEDVRRLRGRRTRSPTSPGGGSSGTSRGSSPDGLRAEIDWDAWERRRCSRWLARTSPRTSSGACSTSGSGTSPSCADPGDDLVIGRIVRA